jgi:16S rRNA U516 pseudouridylate synthase RsuA-like enzyme
MFTEKVLVCLTKVQKENLKKYAAEYGMTISQLIRSSIQTFILQTTQYVNNAEQD